MTDSYLLRTYITVTVLDPDLHLLQLLTIWNPNFETEPIVSLPSNIVMHDSQEKKIYIMIVQCDWQILIHFVIALHLYLIYDLQSL